MDMKKYPLTTKLLALLMISGLTSFQVRGDDGIAARAFAAQVNPPATAPEVRTVPPQGAPEKTAVKRTSTKPAVHRVATVTRSESVPETGIKAPPGNLIHPERQDAGVSLPVTRIRPQQEDYHTQQMY
jgi:hypothetical protein